MQRNNGKAMGGRPKKSENLKRVRVVFTKLNEMEYQLVKARANKTGMSMYEYLRNSILKCKPSLGLTLEELTEIKALVRLGNRMMEFPPSPGFCYPGRMDCDDRDKFQKLLDSLFKKLSL